MKERGLSKDEAFMVETAQSAEVTSQQKKKKDKHKAAFGEPRVCVAAAGGLGFTLFSVSSADGFMLFCFAGAFWSRVFF